jgi:glutamate racemase
VLGTKGTVKREYTKALIKDFAQGCDVTLVGAENLASLAEAALKGERISDKAIAAEIAPCFLNGDARTDTVVLACTHYPLLSDRLIALAPWNVDWIDPAPAIARRVSDLLGPSNGATHTSPARFIFTSGQEPSPVLAKALEPFFGASLVN